MKDIKRKDKKLSLLEDNLKVNEAALDFFPTKSRTKSEAGPSETI